MITGKVGNVNTKRTRLWLSEAIVKTGDGLVKEGKVLTLMERPTRRINSGAVMLEGEGKAV